jgi:serine phosphatase RsbU (regulator of sigma subunit)
VDLEKKPFTDQKIDLKKNDTVYLFTDGFADQFGGPLEKKFSYRRLRELLLANSERACAEQREILDRAFNDWRGALEQIDDVCVIGIKIN